MQLCFLPIIAALAATVVARPASVDYVIHEKRDGPSSWTSKSYARPDGRIRLPVKIGLKERNIESGQQLLMNIADPASKDYGKHMTPEQVKIRSTAPLQHY